MFIIIQAFPLCIRLTCQYKRAWTVDCGLWTAGWPAGYKTWASYKKWTMGSSPEVHSVVCSSQCLFFTG